MTTFSNGTVFLKFPQSCTLAGKIPIFDFTQISSEFEQQRALWRSGNNVNVIKFTEVALRGGHDLNHAAPRIAGTKGAVHG